MLSGEGGFTLIELVVALTLVTTLVIVGVPMFSRVRENAKQKAYIAEAEMACAAVGTYLAEQSLAGTQSSWDIYLLLLMNPLGSEENPITSRMGGYTKGAKLRSVQYNTSTFRYEGIIYEVDGYVIEVYPEDGVSKIVSMGG